MERCIDNILEEGALDSVGNVVDDALLVQMRDQMRAAGFNEAEIDNMLNLIVDCGSIEAATEVLKEIVRKAEGEQNSTSLEE